jgi:pimeloyl-ACP methyl ester carboxylesterase
MFGDLMGRTSSAPSGSGCIEAGLARTAAISIAAVFFAVAAMLAPIAACAQLNPTSSTESDGGERVSFVTADGITLRGHLYGRGSTGVILAHMYPADQQDWADFARVLAANGYRALTFDFRGFSESEGSSGVEFADRDLQAAYGFMRPKVDRIFLAGASMGADASILVAVHQPVAGIICISTPIRFRGLDVEDAITHIHAPLLLITSAQDSLVTGESEALLLRAPKPRALKTFPGHAHGTALLYGPYAADLQRLMLTFIRDHDAHTGG